MKDSQIDSFCPSTRQQWRKWLQKNHDKTESVWLICYKKQSGKPVVAWSDFVDEALCFGWIDSIRKSIDDEKFMQRFSRRKPNSTWSKVNKLKVRRLIQAGLMTEAGLNAIKTAKQNGSWALLDEVEEMIIPADLERAFKKKAGSKRHFLSLSRSVRRVLLLSLVMAKTETTRAKRINQIVEQASSQGK